jgi:hypothetical protein
VSLFSAGDAAYYAQSQAVWTGVVRFLAYLGWALTAALAGTAVCWGFGYVACGGWTSRAALRSPEGEAWAPDDDLDRQTADEVARGLTEIEGYLAAAAQRREDRLRSRPQQPPRPGERDAA